MLDEYRCPCGRSFIDCKEECMTDKPCTGACTGDKDAEIANLKRDLALYMMAANSEAKYADELKAKVDSLQAECASLRADALRYRWLREQPNNTDTPRIDVVRWTIADESANDGEGIRLNELDAAIDAAIAAKEGE